MKVKSVLLILLILLLCGCDNKECVKSHKEKRECVKYTYSYIYNGKTMITIPNPHYYECEVTVCDEWSDK